MADEVLTVPPGSDGVSEPPVAATLPPPQGAAEPQDPGTRQVEPGNNVPQDADAPRRKPSDFYRERQWKRNLEDKVGSVAQQQAELLSLLREKKDPGAPANGPFDLEAFFKNPEPTFAELKNEIKREIESVRNEVRGWKQEQTSVQAGQKRQEALELLFPKMSAESQESLEARVNSDPERTERILEVLKTPGVIQLFETNPKSAVKFVLMEAGEPAKKATIIDKKLLGSTARGSPGGGKAAMTEQDLRAELRKLKEEVERDPALRGNEDYVKRKARVMNDLTKLMEEGRE